MTKIETEGDMTVRNTKNRDITLGTRKGYDFKIETEGYMT